MKQLGVFLSAAVFVLILYSIHGFSAVVDCPIQYAIGNKDVVIKEDDYVDRSFVQTFIVTMESLPPDILVNIATVNELPGVRILTHTEDVAYVDIGDKPSRL